MVVTQSPSNKTTGTDQSLLNSGRLRL